MHPVCPLPAGLRSLRKAGRHPALQALVQAVITATPPAPAPAGTAAAAAVATAASEAATAATATSGAATAAGAAAAKADLNLLEAVAPYGREEQVGARGVRA